MQLIPYWRDTPFRLASPERRKSFLEQAGFELENNNRLHVFYVSSQAQDIFVICCGGYIAEELPEELRIFKGSD